MLDPQNLTLAGKVRALVALGRIPLASETPLWTVLGCVIASKTFPTTASTFTQLWIAAQCVFVTHCTNISINYSNDWHDFELDHPEQVESIKRDVEAREGKEGEAPTASSVGGGVAPQPQANEKIFSNASRVVHDGTFPPWTAVAISVGVQVLPLILILCSRHLDPTLNPSSISTLRTPFKGLTLWIGLISIIFSHEYIGPPLRLHYNGYGEVTSTLLLSVVSALFGMTGCFTALHPQPILPSDLFHPPTLSTFGIDKTLWIMLAAVYCVAQARILVMHIHDIDVDGRGGKNTLVVRVGYEWAARMYVGLNVVGVTLWLWLVGRLVQGKGAMLGDMRSVGVGKGWALGVAIVLLYSIPVMVLTAHSLFVHLPNRPKSTSRPTLIPLRDLAKVVSLQMLVTPVVLSIAILGSGV